MEAMKNSVEYHHTEGEWKTLTASLKVRGSLYQYHVGHCVLCEIHLKHVTPPSI